MSLTNSVADITTLIRGFIKDQARTDGRDSFEYESDDKFTLSERFVDADSIRVLKNGTELDEDDWSFNADTNQVEIDPVTSGVSLVANDVILILYSYYKKYSDLEIKGYLSSALGYFSLHRYKKIFDLTDDDTVVSINDLDPDEKELYFIAIIASILIDPQNIRMRTSEFELSANRSTSDQDQIKTAFTHFKRMVGTVTFDITEFERNWFV